jgi:hypothetical protein
MASLGNSLYAALLFCAISLNSRIVTASQFRLLSSTDDARSSPALLSHKEAYVVLISSEVYLLSLRVSVHGNLMKCYILLECERFLFNIAGAGCSDRCFCDGNSPAKT